MSDLPIVKPEVVFAEELLDDIEAGKLRLPPFQRPFVWKPNNMRELFDSIYKGYPIGSLLLWESTKKIESLDKVGPLSVNKPNIESLSYILDGQQRLATLFGCLRLPNDFLKETEEDRRWWISFDLKSKEFVHTYTRKEPWLLPLRAVLNTFDFLKWGRDIINDNPENAEKWIEEAESLAKKIKSYKVAVIRIYGGSLEEAVEIFSRLNSTGQAMKPDQMVSALTYTDGKKGKTLSDHIDNILEDLADYQFSNMSRMTIFRTIVSATGNEIHRSDWERLSKKLLSGDLKSAINLAKNALNNASKFLHKELGVPHDKFLPYSNQLLILSEFFKYCPSPNNQQINILHQWFWWTSLSDSLVSANTTQLNWMLKDMEKWAKNSNNQPEILSSDSYHLRTFPIHYDFRNGRVCALLIFMFSVKPLNLETGQAIDYKSLQEDPQKIFPRQLRKNRGTSPANRLLINKIPRESIRLRLLSISEEYRDKVLKSHFINADAFEALEQNNIEEFLQIRAKELEQKEKKFIENTFKEITTISIL